MGVGALGHCRMALAQLVEFLPPKRRKAAVAYILSWMGAAAAAVLLLVALSARDPRLLPAEVALFFLVTAAADAAVLRLHHGESTEYVSLLEAAVCINIVVFPPEVALAVTLGGSAISHVLLRQHPVKAAFNLAQYAVAAVSAIVLFQLVAGDAAIGVRTVIGVMVGMASFGLLNSAALAGLVSILDERDYNDTLKEGFGLSMITVLGNTAVGVLAAVMWVTHPELTPLFLAPAAILHLAYGGVVRTRELLEEVVSERNRLNRIIVGSSDGIALIESDGTVGVWSPALARLTGIEADAAAGRPVEELFAATDLDERPVDLLEPMRTATPEEPTSTAELLLRHKEGDNRVVRVRHTVLFDAGGRPTGDAVLIHDITQEHEADKLKDDFLARVSHELRTPLTPIKGYAQSLLRRGDAIPKAARDKAVTSILERTDHMQALIDDLLLVSRIIGGRATLDDQIQARDVDVREVCERVLQSFADEPREFSLEARDKTSLAFADPARVTQIVTNLVSNACKYSDPGRPVDLVVRGDDQHVAVDVVDRGRGISPHHIDKVFDRFFRVEDPLTMTTGGVGLGLHISRELAHAMKGELTVTSTLGEGSTFTLSLPRSGDKP